MRQLPSSASWLDHFSALSDPRQRWRVLYPLPEILLLVLCATLSGLEDFVEIRLWGDERLDFLRRFLPYERGLPAHDTLNDVINGLDAALFKTCFANWVETLRDSAPDIIAIDGKTSQDSGVTPFEVWCLPKTIAQHIDGLLQLYLKERATAIAKRITESGLIKTLRSGNDARLVVDLARADPVGAKLPCDRLGLYGAAVAAAWPPGEDRLAILEAAVWKLMSERGPNEDKWRLKPDDDAPKDRLQKLAAAREQYNRPIRLIREAPPFYEFVHDQMNAYLAARWLVGRATIASMREEL